MIKLSFAMAKKLGFIFIEGRAKTLELVQYKGNSTEVEIPGIVEDRKVTFISDSAFSGCDRLESVTIQNGVTEIGYSAFSECVNLKMIIMPESLKIIGWSAFNGCSSLTSILIPKGVKEICSSAFAGCSNLTRITISRGVKKIDNCVFKDCSSLAGISIPSGVKKIEKSAFEGCSSLTDISIPKGVEEIGWSAFKGCSSLESILIPDSVTSISGSAFIMTKWLEHKKGFVVINDILHKYMMESEVKNLTIPEGVKKIGNEAFKGCNNLIDIKIPDSVTAIDYSAFVAEAIEDLNDFKLEYYRILLNKNKGADYRTELIDQIWSYLGNTSDSSAKLQRVLRILGDTLLAEYDFYEAISVCDVLEGSEYEDLYAYSIRVECLLKLGKIDEALEVLNSKKVDLMEITKNLNDGLEKENYIKILEKVNCLLVDYLEKKQSGYFYLPATKKGRDKLNLILVREGRFTEIKVPAFKKQADFDTFIAFDFETTGLSIFDKIIEIGAVKVVDAVITEEFSELVYPGRKLQPRITDITGITDEMLVGRDTIRAVFTRFLGFIEGFTLVAHNASFDAKYLYRDADSLNRKIRGEIFDTLEFSRKVLPFEKTHKLGMLTDLMNIELTDAHRALNDAKATAMLYLKLKKLFES